MSVLLFQSRDAEHLEHLIKLAEQKIDAIKKLHRVDIRKADEIGILLDLSAEAYNLIHRLTFGSSQPPSSPAQTRP